MSPKEKAIELVDKYLDITLNVESDDDINKYTAKQCALIAVDEMISVLPFTDINTSLGKYCENERAYLKQVRHEIKKYEGIY